MKENKGKKQVVSENGRCTIIQNMNAVDEAVLVSILDKVEILKENNLIRFLSEMTGREKNDGIRR